MDRWWLMLVHLSVKGRAACGVPYMGASSTIPTPVTCRRCAHTLAMADAEARLAVDPNRKRIQRREQR
jgi:hypothetical protein